MSEPDAPLPRRFVGSLLLLSALLRAQAPPGNPMPTTLEQADHDPKDGDAALSRFRLGVEARGQGNLEAARHHLLSALEFHPASPAILQELVLACADAPDQQARFAEGLLRTMCDPQGRVRIDSALRRTLPKEDLLLWERLCQTRAAAAAEVSRAAGRLKDGKGTLGNGAIARLYAELGHELMADAPALYRAHGSDLQQACDRHLPAYAMVVDALRRLMQRAPTVTRPPGDGDGDGDEIAVLDAWRRQQEQSIRAARILAGIARQATFRDRQGPEAPDLGDLQGAAAEARDRLQAESEQRVGRVWTIAELEALDPAARSDFTLAHRYWSTPGLALSPNALYRIETVCGFETLLGAAQTIELHHRRLADHYGVDPFQGRQGTVRIVPEHSGLEEEGAPYWWAGGFQSGDRTVIRFAWNNVPAMGRILTHELTHRFDGAIFPFQPAWLTEGHAVWTGAAYGRMADDHFADRHLDIGSCLGAAGGGYGRLHNLTKLLDGSIDDYRDNYAAGCALYTFLFTWPIVGEPKYRPRLGEFRKNGRAGAGKPVEFFTRLFCDGKEGRPASLAVFAGEFEDFLDGIARWADRRRDQRNRWIGHYQLDLGPRDHAEMVPDEPTWSWARQRAEPWFGQGHMVAAGELLEEVGEIEAAAGAWLWSLQVDGWQAETTAPLPRLLQQLGLADAAFAATVLGRSRFPSIIPAPATPAPMALPRTRAHQQQLRKCRAAATALGHHVAAQLLAAEHDRLAAWLGAQAAPATAPPQAIVDPTRLLGTAGWIEDGLTGFEDQRSKGLWFATPDLDLHVGREKPRDATGLKDRASHRRDAFVRTADWQPAGHYVIRTRLHFTTSFAAGAVVFGHTRRDRGARLLFDAGDFLYAIGKEDKERTARKIWLELQGLWERDEHLPGSHPAFEFEMANDAAGLAIELHVHGPSVLVMIDGEAAMRYATHDGAPIEGAIGFATSMGAIRVQQPTVQRLDRTGSVPPATAVAAVGLDLAAPKDRAVADLLLHPVQGVPSSDCGTMLLWIPPADDLDGLLLRLRKLMPYLAGMLTDAVQYPQAFRLCVPEALGEADLQRVQEIVAGFHNGPLPVLRHRWREPFVDGPWVMFVDQPGLLRAAAQMGDVQLFSRVGRWARLFRRR